MKAKIMVIVIGVVFLVGCAGGLTNLTKEGVEAIDTALNEAKARHVLVLNLWAKHNARILAYIGNDLYSRLSADDAARVIEFTQISDISPSQRTEWDLGHSERLLHKIGWMGLREAISIFAPELLLFLPGL